MNSSLIVLARKPLSEKSVVENVIKWGTGGINIDGCRIGFNGDKPKECELVDFRGDGSQMNLNASGKDRKVIEDRNYIPNDEGRFPANIIFDEEAAKLLDEQSGVSKSSPNILKDKYKDLSRNRLMKRVKLLQGILKNHSVILNFLIIQK